ncbi:MAG: hypothetical protein ACTSRB_10570 [Candidatus Helarchaeota archaeon]
MNERFEGMVDRIIQASKMEITGGVLTQAFLEEAKRGPIDSFITKFNQAYKQWTKKYGNHTISPFLDQKKLGTVCEIGRSNVDAIIKINYVFEPQELEIINNCLSKYGVIAESPKDVAKLFLSNATKILSRFFTPILTTSYRLYTSSVNIESLDDGCIKIALTYDGRIG